MNNSTSPYSESDNTRVKYGMNNNCTPDCITVDNIYIKVWLKTLFLTLLSNAAWFTLFFPNQNTNGTHVNISGAGVTKYSKNKENAVKLLEFLVSPKAQSMFAEANYEYPVNKNVEPSELLKSWGTFKEDTLALEELGKNNAKAVKIFNEVKWK